MPGPAEILDGLHRIANDMVWLAIGWHVVLLAALAFAGGGWRPRRAWAAVLLATPLVSVSAIAWAYANPFDGAVVGAVALALIGTGLSLGRESIEAGPKWARWLGLVLVVYGAVYPHFLDTATLRSYIIAAPTGLLPSPSLAVLIGLGLMADGLGSRSWSFVAAAAGLFYGLFGVLRLGVYLDAGLVLGSLALGAHGLALHARRRRAPGGPPPRHAERPA